MFTFRKVLFNRYCNMEGLQLYFNWSGKYIVSPVVLKCLQARRIIKNIILIADILELEGLEVSD